MTTLRQTESAAKVATAESAPTIGRYPESAHDHASGSLVSPNEAASIESGEPAPTGVEEAAGSHRGFGQLQQTPHAVRGMRAYAAGVLGLDLVLTTVAALVAQYVWLGQDAEIAGQWRGSTFGGIPYTAVALGLVAFWLVILATRGAYTPRVFTTGPDEFKRVVGGSVLTAGLVAIVCYLAKVELARGFVAVAFPLGLLLLLGGRLAARKWLQWQRRHGRFGQRVLVVGMPAGVFEVREILGREPHLGMNVVGACVPHLTSGRSDEAAGDVPILGRIDDTADLVASRGIDTVIVTTLPGRSSRLLRRLSWSLEGLGVDLVVVPSLTDVAGPRVHVRPVAGLPLLHVEEPQFTGARRIVKAVTDWLGAVACTLVATPVMLAIAAAIKVDDGGPVFFRQTRVGVNGSEFSCLKFRSMVIDAEQQLSGLQEDNEHDGVLFKIRQDPRITRVGRLLRGLSLDELPQLINVLRGEMSLIGPRPPLPSEVAQYGEDARRRLLVKPGITGLWQVSGRSNLSWEDSVRLDLYYVENWSLWTDLVILVKTVGAVLRRDGAY